MFKKIFGKKEIVVSDEKADLNKLNNNDQLADAVNNSTLKMLTHELFMHYYDPTAILNINDSSWQNQAIFFWQASESFERKSLPPNFKEMEHRFFICNGIPDGVILNKGQVIPWFGMPGNGDKYFFSINGENVLLQLLVENNHLQYIELITLTEHNKNILFDRENYYLLLDSKTMSFDPKSDKFFFDGVEVTLGMAFRKDGVKIIRYI
jgi:hypothetical protein